MDCNIKPIIDAGKEKELWDNALIVLDTSAICALYDLTLHYRRVIISILKCLHDRIWIPYQVLSEYKANRAKAIHNPIREKYPRLKLLDDKFIQDARSQIEKWVKNEYFHPYIDDDQLLRIKKEVEDANKHIRVIKEIVKNQYAKRIEEIKAIIDNDELLEYIKSINCGPELSYEQIKKIVLEGDWRYRHQIPPGYKDASTKDGIRKFGDLIIWKEIINRAISFQDNVIFICDDRKEDWYTSESAPRIELLCEFQENTGKNIWFYTVEGFIAKLQEYYKDTSPVLPLYGQLEEVAIVLRRIVEEKKRGGVAMRLRCDYCRKEFVVWANELNLEWDRNGSFDGGMGPETEWIASFYITCKHCQQQIEISCFAYEYPVGVYDMGDIVCNGAELISDFDVEAYAPIGTYVDAKDVCLRCGEPIESIELDENGLCPNCSHK